MMTEDKNQSGAPPPGTAETVTPPEPSPGAAPSSPDTPPTAKDLRGFAKRRHLLSEKQRALKAREEAFAIRDANWQRLAQEREAKEAARDKQIADMQAEIEAYKKSPLVKAAEAGADPNEVLRDYMDRSAPERQIKALADELAALKKEKAQEAERQRQAELQRQQAWQHHQEQQAVISFTNAITKEAKKYPNLCGEYTPQQIAEQAWEVHQWAKSQKWQDETTGEVRQGVEYTFQQVAEFLEHRAKAAYAQKEERRKSLLEPQAPPGQQAETEAAPGSGSREAGPARTEKQKPKTPPRPLTAEEQKAEDLAMLRDAMAKDKADRERANRPTKH